MCEQVRRIITSVSENGKVKLNRKTWNALRTGRGNNFSITIIRILRNLPFQEQYRIFGSSLLLLFEDDYYRIKRAAQSGDMNTVDEIVEGVYFSENIGASILVGLFAPYSRESLRIVEWGFRQSSYYEQIWANDLFIEKVFSVIAKLIKKGKKK